MTGIERLTPTDLINVYVETPSAPARVGALALLDGALTLDELRTHIARRLPGLSRLRQIIHRPGWLAGRPIWVDAPAVDIAYHVREIALPATERLSDLAVRLTNGPLTADRPLWRIWLVTGLPGDQAALVFTMHHVVADGMTTVRLFEALTDDGVPMSRRTAPPPPAWSTLVRDNLAHRVTALRAIRRPKVSQKISQWREMAALRHAPRNSLNAPVGARRRLDTVTVDLGEAKAAAHQHGGKVNDVVLALAAGGVRELLRSRSEPVDGVLLHVTVAVALRDSAAGGGRNRTGGFAAHVPLEADVHERLRLIAGHSAQVKTRQVPTAGNGLLIGLSRLGVLAWFSRHQRMINFVESNVAGPTAPLRLLGTTIVDVIPIGTVVGNITLGFLALSYAGRLTIAVQADADRYPDLPILLTAMRRDAERLGLTALIGGTPWTLRSPA